MIIDALGRTFRLMRTDLTAGMTDEVLFDALRSTRVVLAADEAALSTHSGQCAFVATATTLARSGHAVWIEAPEVRLIGAQPPLRGEWMMAGLRELGGDLLPNWQFEASPPPAVVDILCRFGKPDHDSTAEIVLDANASDWGGSLFQNRPTAWTGSLWPIGGLVVAGLVSAEAFKVAMRKLSSHAVSSGWFDELYAPTTSAEVKLAPDGTPKVSSLGRFDMVSAGAIGNALFHILLRLPNVSGSARAIDKDVNSLTNLNRNALLRRSRLDHSKVEDLASYGDGLEILPVPHRFEGGEADMELAEVVLVGVDHIPSRWVVQRTRPRWLGIGASEGFAAHGSVHQNGQACAQCLHAYDVERTGEIPTVAFVSYWAGLLLAASFLRFLTGERPDAGEQQIYYSTLRPESWALARAAAPVVPGCPTCGSWSTQSAENECVN